jgi:hypothetical protein
MTTSLTQAKAKELFEYRDGLLLWKIRPKNSRKPKGDMEAGTVTTGGYKKITYQQKKYYVHRIVYLLEHGYMPNLIDHIDGNSLNNKIENLRQSDKSKNACNSKLRVDNSSGHKGVIWHKKTKKWMVRVQKNIKSNYVGLYEDFELACLVSNEARNLYHGNYARI